MHNNNYTLSMLGVCHCFLHICLEYRVHVCVLLFNKHMPSVFVAHVVVEKVIHVA